MLVYDTDRYSLVVAAGRYTIDSVSRPDDFGEEMNKRERRIAEAKAKAELPVSIEILEHWANWQVGGSGMSHTTQTMIKKMAIEILEARKKNG